jgi:hypothetical protein
MKRLPLLAWAAWMCGIVPSAALADSVVVPDQFTTVQSAIDSGADSVLIRPGTYPESLRITEGVTLLGIGPQRPRLNALTIAKSYASLRVWTVGRIDFLDPVELATPHGSQVSFFECVLAAGLRTLSGDPWDIMSFSLRDCLLEAPSRIAANGVEMEDDTLDTGIWLECHNTLALRRCWFRGGPGTAIELHNDGPLGGVIGDNRIEDYAVGVFANVTEGLVIEANAIAGCGTGIVLEGGHYGGIIVRNNRIESCGTGITALVSELYVFDNTVLRAAGHGMVLDADYEPLVVERNVVGQCDGTGIVVRLGANGASLRNNTVFGNGGSGFEIDNPHWASVTVQANIAANNSGWGLVTWQSIALGCNDWFGNGHGAASGATPDPTDLNLDPLFCDVEHADVSLSSGSPLLDAPGCGRIGALGAGCGPTPALAGLLRAEPAREGVRIEWRWGTSEPPAAFWIERADEAGGPWMRIVTDRRPEGPATVEWDHSVEPGRTYFYRLAWVSDGGDPERSEATRVTALGAARLAFESIAPNPSSGRVEIVWSLPRAGPARLAVLDIAGRQVAWLANGSLPAGRHRSVWDGRSGSGRAAPGVYLVRLHHEGRDVTARVLLRR